MTKLIKMRYYVGLLLFISFVSCKNKIEEQAETRELNKEKTPAEVILDKAIMASGGIENWKNLDSIQFYKMSKLYLEDGGLEDSTYQLHTYYMYPEMNGKYSWVTEGKSYEVVYNHGVMTKSIDDKKINLSPEEAEKLRLSFLGSQFVMSMPFKLTDSGVELSIDKPSQINDKDVITLKASYNTKNENHTKTHDWWYYLNSKTYALEGYKVHHPPTYARVSNVTTTKVKGVAFPTYRESHRTDADDNEQYVRAEFWYEFLK